MEKEKTAFVPLLEDVETHGVSSESIYPVKKQERNKPRRVNKFLKAVLKVVFVFFLVAFTVAAVAGYRLYRWMSHEVQQFTVEESNSFPVQEVPESELEALKDTGMLFWDQIQLGIVPEDFVFTARDVNGFFARSDFLRGNAFAEMKPNEYKMSFSLPTDGLPGGKGRFFNAYETINWFPETNHLTVKVDPLDLEEHCVFATSDGGCWVKPIGQFVNLEFELTTMEDGKTLNLQLLKGRVFDHRIPEDFIEEQYNLLSDLYNCDPLDYDCKQTSKFLQGLAGVSLKDGQVVVHAERDSTEATYYKEHEAHSWHHGNHGQHHHHHGKHGRHHDGRHHREFHGEHYEPGMYHKGHHHGGHRALRENRAKTHSHGGHWRALHMVRKLMAY